MECEPCEPTAPPPPPEPVGYVDFDVDDAIGGFAMLCRCGRQRCSTHLQPTADGSRVVLGPEVEPDSYDLSLKLRLDDHAFDGEIIIDVVVTADKVTTVTLHAKDLVIHAASFAGAAPPAHTLFGGGHSPRAASPLVKSISIYL